MVFIENLKLVQMNKQEKSRERGLEGLIANVPFILRTSPARPMAPVNGVGQKKTSSHAALILVSSMGAIAVLFYMLRRVPIGLLRPEFVGLGVVACALAYVGIFLGIVTRALAQDEKQAERSEQTLTYSSTWTASQTCSQQETAGNLTVEMRR